MTNKPSSTDQCAWHAHLKPGVNDGDSWGCGVCGEGGGYPADFAEQDDQARPVGDDELVARLRHTRIVTLNGQSGPVPLNPDGPEAADRITDLQTRLGRYREAAEYAHGVLTTTNRFDPAQCDEAAEALGKALSDGEG